MSWKKLGITAAAVAAAGGLAFGGAALATAANSPSTAGAKSGSAQSGDSQDGRRGNGPQDGRGPGGHEHTEVTGDELTQVTDAVKAKDSSVTVEEVRKDPDGSYDVMGTKDGKRTMFEVSADKGTVTERAGGPGRGQGGPGRMNLTEVTGEEATKVTDAVKAEDSAFTPERVMKDEDGGYHVMGTKDGKRAGYQVSADLATVTAHTPGEGPGGRGGPMGDGPRDQQGSQQKQRGSQGTGSQGTQGA